MPDINSIGLGGGSIVRITNGEELASLTVGPDSVGHFVSFLNLSDLSIHITLLSLLEMAECSVEMFSPQQIYTFGQTLRKMALTLAIHRKSQT